ncbi:MAG: hypothetical protein WBY53_12740 [Acidobacteriaceae bacterium]
MFELFKLLTDALVLRDASRKGILTWKVMLFGFGFAIFLYVTALPATLLYEKHPQYLWFCLTTLAIDCVAFILFLIFGTRWYFRAIARAKARNPKQP